MSRGRGRAVCPVVDDSLPREPYMVRRPESSLRSVEVDIYTDLDRLFLSPLDDFEVFNLLHGHFAKHSTNPEQLKKSVRHILNKCILDPMNVDLIMKYMYILFQNKEFGINIKKNLFTILQELHVEKESLKSMHGSFGYRNFMMLFGSITEHCRDKKISPMIELTQSLFDMIVPLLSSNQEEDIKIFAIHIARYSRYLRMYTVDELEEMDNPNMEDISVNIRKRLSNRSSETCIQWLLAALETSLYEIYRGEEGLTPKARRYYVSILGSQVNKMWDDEQTLRIPRRLMKYYNLEDIDNTLLRFID